MTDNLENIARKERVPVSEVILGGTIIASLAAAVGGFATALVAHYTQNPEVVNYGLWTGTGGFISTLLIGAGLAGRGPNY